jgi:hypothetical protein
MNNVAPIGLGLVAAALAGILVMEWGAGEAWHERAPRAVPAFPPGELFQQIAAGTADNTTQWIDTIRARPLFTPGRRPPHQSHVKAPTPTTTAGPPRLAGVLVSPAGKAAIFAGSGPKPVVVREGGRLGQFAVQSIEAGRVTLRGPEGAIVLQPTFENEAKPATASPPGDPENATGRGGMIVHNAQ